MTRQQALRALAQGIVADAEDCGRLRALLGEQFDAALRHQTTRLAAVGAGIVALAAAMEARRVERVTLAARLTGGSGAMPAAFSAMPQRTRERLETIWAGLEALVCECKALNARNCRLIMAQHEIMQRVLGAEADTYAAA